LFILQKYVRTVPDWTPFFKKHTSKRNTWNKTKTGRTYMYLVAHR